MLRATPIAELSVIKNRAIGFKGLRSMHGKSEPHGSETWMTSLYDHGTSRYLNM